MHRKSDSGRRGERGSAEGGGLGSQDSQQGAAGASERGGLGLVRHGETWGVLGPASAMGRVGQLARVRLQLLPFGCFLA